MCACVCIYKPICSIVVYVFCFFLSGGTGGETLHRCVGDMWNFSSCFARRSSGLFFLNSEGEQRAARTLGSLFLFMYLFSKCNRRYLKLSPSPINSLWTDHQVALSGSFFKILDFVIDSKAFWSVSCH